MAKDKNGVKTKVTGLEEVQKAKKKPEKVIDFLNDLHLTKAGRPSIVVLPNFQGSVKHLMNRQVEALEKIAKNLAKIAEKQ